MACNWITRTIWRRVWLALGVTFALLVVAGCSAGATGDEEQPGGGSFSVGVPTGFISHFIPGRTGNSYIESAVWTPLTTIDPQTGKVVNAVAKSLDSPDQKTWTITLEDGWTFHDGSPVTAQSFADAWNAAAYGPNGWIGNSQFAIIDGYAALNPTEKEPSAKKLSGVEVVDKHTLRVSLTEPSAQFPYIIASTTWAPMPKVAFDDLEAFDKSPMGNGPFMVAGEGLTAGAQGLTLQRYEKFAGDPAKAQQVQLKFFQDSGTAYTSFKAGTVDIALVEGVDRAEAESRFAERFVDVPFPAVVYLGFPLWEDKFRDVRVRQAFALAIDREEIATALLRGAGEPATGIAPEAIVGSDSDACALCELDVERARQLLAEAGGWTGDLTLWTYQDPTNRTVLEAVANQLRSNLGIEDVSLEAQPADQIYANLPAHAIHGPFLLYTGVQYPHQYAMVDWLFKTGSFFNVTGYSNDDVDGLLQAAAASGRPEQMIERSQEAADAALADVPLTPIYFPKGGLVYSEHVDNVTPEVLGGVHLDSVTVS